jgi:hypothetical protein
MRGSGEKMLTGSMEWTLGHNSLYYSKGLIRSATIGRLVRGLLPPASEEVKAMREGEEVSLNRVGWV